MRKVNRLQQISFSISATPFCCVQHGNNKRCDVIKPSLKLLSIVVMLSRFLVSS